LLSQDGGHEPKDCPRYQRQQPRHFGSLAHLIGPHWDARPSDSYRQHNGYFRKQPFSFDKKSYKQRHRIENAFGRLKDFRRIAIRYDRLARNFLASVCLVAAMAWWML
jgi:transposase